MNLRRKLRSLREFAICKDGIWFPYKGDVILYVFPWRRDNCVFVSVLSEGGFTSLKEIDRFWSQFAELQNSEGLTSLEDVKKELDIGDDDG